jgi:hypothetical protein
MYIIVGVADIIYIYICVCVCIYIFTVIANSPVNSFISVAASFEAKLRSYIRPRHKNVKHA